MIYKNLGLGCLTLIKKNMISDCRGFFSRSFCKVEFEENGLNSEFVQTSYSFNKNKATLRGLHYQVAPHEEIKLVTCVRGEIFDVAVDVRKGSETFGSWRGCILGEDSLDSLYIPSGFAHGFITLRPNSLVCYDISVPYCEDFARVIKYNSPRLRINWPVEPEYISYKDAHAAEFSE